MPKYRIVVTGPDGRQDSTVADFAEDAVAIAAARQTAGPVRPVVAVIRQAGAADTLLGAWEYEEGETRWWSEE